MDVLKGKGDKKGVELTVSDVRCLYNEKLMTVSAIAEMIGWSDTGVCTFMDEYGIERRTAKQQQMVRFYGVLDHDPLAGKEDAIKGLYEKEFMGLSAIATRYNVSKKRVKHLLQQNNVAIRTRAETYICRNKRTDYTRRKPVMDILICGAHSSFGGSAQLTAVYIEQLYREGRSVREVAELCGLKEYKVSYFMSKNNIQRRSMSEATRLPSARHTLGYPKSKETTMTTVETTEKSKAVTTRTKTLELIAEKESRPDEAFAADQAKLGSLQETIDHVQDEIILLNDKRVKLDTEIRKSRARPLRKAAQKKKLEAIDADIAALKDEQSQWERQHAEALRTFRDQQIFKAFGETEVAFKIFGDSCKQAIDKFQTKLQNLRNLIGRDDKLNVDETYEADTR